MLALQLPSSMPHAVPSRQPVTTLPPLACQKLDESISSNSYPRSGSVAKPYLPTLGRNTAAWQAGSLTPPGEMIRPYDRQGAAQLNGDGVQGATDMVARLAGYAGPALPYPAPQNTHYSGSQPSGQRTNPSYQSPTAMAASATASAPSAPPTIPKAVAPSLRIPHTIAVPQTSMPQLAAEVINSPFLSNSLSFSKLTLYV